MSPAIDGFEDEEQNIEGVRDWHLVSRKKVHFQIKHSCDHMQTSNMFKTHNVVGIKLAANSF